MPDKIYFLLEKARLKKASDLHLSIGALPMCRVNSTLTPIDSKSILEKDIDNFIKAVLTDTQLKALYTMGDIDASISYSNNVRLRVNVFRQKGSYSISFRLLNHKIPGFDSLGLPPVIESLCKENKGLILVTGPTGAGKSTTLAAMIDWINSNRELHIVTLEEPIEYIHKHNRSIINQREIGKDSPSFKNALKGVLRQDPDVILIGEMRDLESIGTALTAAETGHLVLATLHTIGAAKTVDRIIDVFPPYQQSQIRAQLSLVLQSVISQQLISTLDGKSRVVAVEIMVVTHAIRNLIRENKTHQITNSILTGGKLQMKTMDNSLFELYRNKKISLENTLLYASDKEYIKKLVGMEKD